MDEQELLKARFKSAISSAVKAISENFDLQIKFGNNIDSKKNSLNLPEVINLKKLQDFTNLRAFADSEALKIKYTDKKIYLENEPKKAINKTLYAIAEKIRYEKIGSNKLKGVKNNITQCYENKFKNKKIKEIKTETDVPITEAFELYLRSYFFNIKQNDVTKKVLSYWKDLFDKNLNKNLKELNSCIENQSKFNQLVADLIVNLNFEDSDSKEKNVEKETTKEDNSLSEKNNKENDIFQKEEKQSNDSDLNVFENNLEFSNKNNDSKQKEVDGDSSLIKRNQKNLLKEKYKIFTSEYDEVKNVEELESEDEITRLRKNLDQQLTNLQNLITKLASKLQRQLLAKQNRSWEFDLEEGILDASKLSRVIINPLHSLSYKNEKKTDGTDREKFALSIGQVFRSEKNEDLPRKSSLDQKMSDIVGELSYNFSKIGKIDYKFSIDHNINDLNYSEISSNFNFGKVNFNLDYLEEQNHVGDEHYVNAGISLNLNDNSKLSVESKKNFKTDSTELYNVSYQYINDCLTAGLVFRREFYEDNDIEQKDSLIFQITFTPFGGVKTPSVINP